MEALMPMVMPMLTVMLMRTEKNHPLVEAEEEEEAGAEGEDEGVDGAVVAVAEADTTTTTTTIVKIPNMVMVKNMFQVQDHLLKYT